jgi:hypothetical protein
MIVLDRAATARGDTDAISRPLVRSLLGALDAKDTVSVTGSIQTDWRAPEEVARATELAWNGQTGAFDLTKVLTQARAHGASVVLVSDGLVADDKAAIAAAKLVGAPIHVIGIGPAPNRSLLAAIANTTGGTIRYATVGDDLAVLAKAALADLAAPPPPLTVTWGVLAARDVVPAQLPRLAAGQAVLVVARVDRARTANARARGDVFVLASIAPSHALEGTTTPKGPLARRWARMKLDELIASGAQGSIAAHAMRYGLVSPMTSMVAIGDDVVVEGGVKHTVPVPVSVPAGMHWQSVQHEVAVDTTTVTTGTSETFKSGTTPKATDKKHPVAKEPAREHAPPVVNEPQPAPPAPKHRARDAEADEDDSARSADAESKSEAPMAPRAAPAPSVALEGEDIGSYDRAESIALTGESITTSTRRLRISVATGAAIESGNTNVVVIPRASFEIGGRTRFGIEGSLWLVGGLNLEGTVLSTISRIGVSRWLDVAGGLGLHLGNGLGPAGAVELRLRLPIRHAATYLRYDGALLLHDSTRDGQNAATFGVEASF